MKRLKKAWIRPIYRDDGVLAGLVLCTSNKRLLLDEEIVERYPRGIAGQQMMIRARRKGYKAEWGNVVE